MIELKGKIWKDPKSSWWLVEIPFLDVMTQGKNRKNALEMIKDAVLELLKDSYEDVLSKKIEVTVTPYEDGIIGISSEYNNLLLALGLKKQRLRHGSKIFNFIL